MSEKWRVGSKVGLNVYAGERPVCQCHSVCDAKTIVDSVNGFKKTVKVSIGKSSLTKDLVWCECGRGLSPTGRWNYCPACGCRIDQESYAYAVELAKANGASFFLDPELFPEGCVSTDT